MLASCRMEPMLEQLIAGTRLVYCPRLSVPLTHNPAGKKRPRCVGTGPRWGCGGQRDDQAQ